MSDQTEKRGRGRPSVGPQITIRIPADTLDAIAASLREGEDRAAFIRDAIAREIKRRRSW